MRPLCYGPTAPTVPVVVLPDGQVLEESRDVVAWALANADPLGWLPSGDEVEETERLIGWNDGEFKRSLDRYKYSTRYEDCDPTAERRKGEEFLVALEERLGPRAYLFREAPMLADVCIFPFVRQFAFRRRKWVCVPGF